VDWFESRPLTGVDVCSAGGKEDDDATGTFLEILGDSGGDSRPSVMISTSYVCRLKQVPLTYELPFQKFANFCQGLRLGRIHFIKLGAPGNETSVGVAVEDLEGVFCVKLNHSNARWSLASSSAEVSSCP